MPLKIIMKGWLWLSLALFVVIGSVDAIAQSQSELSGYQVADFQPVSADAGWLLLNQQLYWTTTGGQAWRDITPPQRGKAAIQAVDFINATNGSLVLSSPDETG